MTSFTALLPEVTLRSAQAPEAAVMLALARATETFCRETWAWQEVVDKGDLELEEDGATVTVLPASGTKAVAITALRVSGQLLLPVGDSAYQVMYASTPMWPPRAYYVPRPDAIALVNPIPEKRIAQAMEELEVTQALAPRHDATTVPNFLIDNHASALVAGALYYLATISGAPSADPGAAKLYSDEFSAGIAMARRNKNAGYVNSTMRVQPQPLAMGSQL